LKQTIHVLQYKESGYDQKVNETVSVVGAQAKELGQKGWGFMRGVMAMASQTVEQYTKEPGHSSSHNEGYTGAYDDGPYKNINSGSDSWQDHNDYEKPQTSKGRDAWDDWDEEDKQAQSKGHNGGNTSSYGRNNVSPPQARTQITATTTKATESKKAATGGDNWTGWDDHDATDDVDTFFRVDHKADKKKAEGWNDWDAQWTEGGFK
jgi:ADP-ribosylation factor GTPase-activating protein 1